MFAVSVLQIKPEHTESLVKNVLHFFLFVKSFGLKNVQICQFTKKEELLLLKKQNTLTSLLKKIAIFEKQTFQ